MSRYRFQVALSYPHLGIRRLQHVSVGSILVAKFVHGRVGDVELANNSVGMIK